MNAISTFTMGVYHLLIKPFFLTPFPTIQVTDGGLSGQSELKRPFHNNCPQYLSRGGGGKAFCTMSGKPH